MLTPNCTTMNATYCSKKNKSVKIIPLATSFSSERSHHRHLRNSKIQLLRFDALYDEGEKDKNMKENNGTPTCSIVHASFLSSSLEKHDSPKTPKQEARSLAAALQASLKEAGCGLERVALAYSKAPSIGEVCKKHKLEEAIVASTSN